MSSAASWRRRVSIHASSREDATRAGSTTITTDRFNPRVLAGGRDGELHQAIEALKFQSTRPRGRTRHGYSSIGSVTFVSIHASSREDATLASRLQFDLECFNPRVLAGGRDPALAHLGEQAVLFQSTRPRGRTRLTTQAITAITRSFNPRVLAGGRDRDYTLVPSDFVFQSTRPRGRTRHVIIHWFLVILCFNPRVLAGGRDMIFLFEYSPSRVSIHASSREDATVL